MKQRLTAKEEELMNVFWKQGEMCIRDLVNSMPEPKPSYTTVATQVGFLEEKGFLERRPVANTNLYKVKITEKEYRGSAVGDMVAKYYSNSYECLVSQFLEDGKLSVDELRDIIEQIEKNK